MTVRPTAAEQPRRADGLSTVNGLIPVAVGYIAVQLVCAATVLLAPARRPTDVEVVLP